MNSMIEEVVKQYATLFASKVRLFNLQTNSKLPYDLATLVRLLSSDSNVTAGVHDDVTAGVHDDVTAGVHDNVTYPDQHPYSVIKRCIKEHLRTLQRKHHVEHCDRLRKSITLAKIHYSKLQSIHVGDHFTSLYKSQPITFRLLEITPCASLRLLYLDESLKHPILSHPKGFIVRVSQSGKYKLRIDNEYIEFIHQPYTIQHLWLWIMKQTHPLFSYASECECLLTMV
jgi:hypothetical protein